jgi:8-oxo-dGTP pyrophosphatase MutT (NUDIX family)/phosphohistidine phosphatase SixA
VDEPEIIAAGAVVSRKGPQVLLIHRPKYDDWSFPKGKLDPGEHLVACAVREVAEETGLDIRLGPPLARLDYTVGNGTLKGKRVYYWAGRVVGDPDVSGYVPNAEVDDVRWVDLDKARRQLTQEHDRELLDTFAVVRKRSTPLVVLRHGDAVSRKDWRGDDRERPMTESGVVQSDALVPLLAAYGIRRIVSSSSRRCWTTLAPYAHVTDTALKVTDALSEEDATAPDVEAVVQDLLADRTPAVLCSHRPVLPHIWDALGVPDTGLEPGGMLVVHHRRGAVVAVEQHAV